MTSLLAPPRPSLQPTKRHPHAAPFRLEASPLHLAYAQELSRLRGDLLDAFDRARAHAEARLDELIRDVQRRLRLPEEHARLTSLADQSLQAIDEARSGTRRGIKKIAHLDQLVADLVDIAIVFDD